MSEEAVDSRFAMPDVDDPATTEVGVILLGLDPTRLLAGLGLATLADDPGRVAITVDRMRHGAGAVDADLAVAEGVRCWRANRPAIAAALPSPVTTAALRRAFERTHRLLDIDVIGDVGPATRTYLTACWIRRVDVDPAAADHVVP